MEDVVRSVVVEYMLIYIIKKSNRPYKLLMLLLSQYLSPPTPRRSPQPRAVAAGLTTVPVRQEERGLVHLHAALLVALALVVAPRVADKRLRYRRTWSQ